MRRGSIEGITNFIGGLNTSVGPLNNPGNLLEVAHNVEVGLDGSLSSRLPFTDKTKLNDVYFLGKADSVFTHNAFAGVNYLSELIVGNENSIISIDTHYWESKDIYVVTFYGESDNMSTGEGSGSPDKYLALAFLESYPGAVAFHGSGVALYFGGAYGEWGGRVEFGEDHIYLPWGDEDFSIGSSHYYIVDYNDLSKVDKNTYNYYRDFAGVPSIRQGSNSPTNTVSTNERLDHISFYQYYNMINSGWPERSEAATEEDGSATSSNLHVLIGTRFYMGTFPALCDDFEKAKIQETSNYISLGAYSPWQNHKQKLIRDAYVPSGSTILELGNERLSRASALDLDEDNYMPNLVPDEPPIPYVTGYSNFVTYENPSEEGDPSLICLAEIDGRMWYNFSRRDFNISFSQIKNSSDRTWREKCYQSANPTDPISNSVVATDGGTISVSDMGKVIKFKKFNNYILMFCDNGVWAITGGEPGASFTPSSFSIFKVSNATVISPKMIANTSAGLAFVSYEGLQFLAVGSNGIEVVNKSENRVDDRFSFFPDMPGTSSMSFDRKSGRLFMNFKDQEHFTGNTYTLVYDIKIDSFYEWALRGLPFGSFQTNPIEATNGKTTFGVMSFNDKGVFSFCVDPYIGYLQDQNNNIASTIPSTSKYLIGYPSDINYSATGCYAYQQTNPLLGVFDSDQIDLYDFGVHKGEQDYAYYRGPYPCAARISYSGQEFNLNKIVEHLSIMYRNGPYANDPTDSDFIAPALYLRPRWDWQYSSTNEDIEVVGYHKYPYQTTYDTKDYMMYRGNIPGKGNLLSLDIFTPVDRSNSGFKILGYAALVTKAGRP